MSTLPKITAVITIVETDDVKKVDFVDVNEMMESVIVNVSMAEIVHEREIKIHKTTFVDDKCNITFVYADTGEPYMTIMATRHSVH